MSLGLSRRRWLAGAAALGAAGSLPARAAPFCSDAEPRLSSISTDPGPLGRLDRRVAWGSAIEAPALYDPRLVEALTREAPNFLAIASGLKFGNLYPTQGDIERGRASGRWGECDDVVALADRLDVPLRGDCLAWNDWQPQWLKDIASDRAQGWQDQLRGYFDDHFTEVFAHFAPIRRKTGGPLLRWCGLVNEPFNPWYTDDGLAAWRTGAWLDAFGTAPDGVPAYIHRAFDLGARHASAETALFLNEANCDNDRFGPLVRPALLKLVDDLQHAGRRIDAVGLECHLVPQWMHDRDRPNWAPTVSFIRDLARRGVKIYLTELDVIDCSVRDATARDALVAHYMSSFVAACLEITAVDMISNWDFSDKYSWLRSEAVYPSLGKWADCLAAPPCPRPDLYDETMQPKAARRALARALAGASR